MYLNSLQNTHDHVPPDSEYLGTRPKNLYIYFLNPPGGSKVQPSWTNLTVVKVRVEAGGKNHWVRAEGGREPRSEREGLEGGGSSVSLPGDLLMLR